MKNRRCTLKTDNRLSERAKFALPLVLRLSFSLVFALAFLPLAASSASATDSLESVDKFSLPSTDTAGSTGTQVTESSNIIVAIPESDCTDDEVSRNITAIDGDIAGGVNLVDESSSTDASDVVTVNVANEDSTDEVLTAMEESGLYEAVEYQHYYSLCDIDAIDTTEVSMAAVYDGLGNYSSTPSDYLYSHAAEWGLRASNFDEFWPSLETAESGDSVTVAVIDTGVDFTHEDIGTDGNTIAGYDYCQSYDTSMGVVTSTDADVSPATVPTDVTNYQTMLANSYHGTMVSSIIAAQTDNAIGVAGAGWDTQVMVYKVSTVVTYNYSSGISVADIVIPTEAVVNAINAAVAADVDVINLSLGAYESDDLLSTAVQNAVDAGIVVVAAGGNSGDVNPSVAVYPAALSGVIAVAACETSSEESDSDISDISVSSYSSYYANTDDADPIDIAAPGTDVAVLYPNNLYAYGDGTSFSAPYVAAAAALLKRIDPDLTSTQIEYLLEESSVDLANGSNVDGTTVGEDIYSGSGFLDIEAAYELLENSCFISRSSLSLSKGKTSTLAAWGDGDISWSTNNAGVATVNSNGQVTAKGGGTATVTATVTRTASDGSVLTHSATCVVTVSVPAAWIRIVAPTYSKTSAYMKIGQRMNLDHLIGPSDTTDKVTWRSSSTGILTVSSTGTVTAKRTGIVSVTARSSSGFSATFKIIVVAKTTAVTSITIPTSVSIYRGASLYLTRTVKPVTTTEQLTWKSSNTAVATVSRNGTITGVSKGTATIMVTSSSGKKDTCRVTIR